MSMRRILFAALAALLWPAPASATWSVIPRTAATRACTLKTAQVAYLLAADPSDPKGTSFNDGRYSLSINVTDQNIRPDEDPVPVRPLRMRYDA